MTEAENSMPKQRGFQKGKSGNPAGKPPGTRNKMTLLAEALLDNEAEALARVAIDRALEGDPQALRLCLDRIVPPRKDRPISFAMPKIESASDAAGAMAAILAAVADGSITAGEAEGVTRLVETYVKVLEASEFEDRLTALEAKEQGGDKTPYR